ncbi:putative ATP-dependent DNA helicase chr12 [Castilleja foliolosa]|uniref:ATP-dependent DNA helicase chr12 n=1 Tax=Castilleja foliolosa TaxID=1961234 RepID=A0ABD3E463_9LAMI
MLHVNQDVLLMIIQTDVFELLKLFRIDKCMPEEDTGRRVIKSDRMQLRMAPIKLYIMFLLVCGGDVNNCPKHLCTRVSMFGGDDALISVLRGHPTRIRIILVHLVIRFIVVSNKKTFEHNLMLDFEDAVLKQRSSCLPSSRLSDLKANRFHSRIQHRLTALEELPTSRGEELQSRCLLELYGLKLAELQNKVRSEVSAEYWLRLHCANPDKQLFDWGMMRLRRPIYGIGDAFAVETDDQLKKKRETERLSRFEEEEKNRIETKQRKFSADLLNSARELQLQVQAAHKRRKQRNDGVQARTLSEMRAWHGRLRQRATRAEKLRFQALKDEDQEAYMKMVEESKNERLTMLLGKTNDLLVLLGAAVQREKNVAHDGVEPLDVSDTITS